MCNRIGDSAVSSRRLNHLTLISVFLVHKTTLVSLPSGRGWTKKNLTQFLHMITISSIQYSQGVQQILREQHPNRPQILNLQRWALPFYFRHLQREFPMLPSSRNSWHKLRHPLTRIELKLTLQLAHKLFPHRATFTWGREILISTSELLLSQWRCLRRDLPFPIQHLTWNPQTVLTSHACLSDTHRSTGR